MPDAQVVEWIRRKYLAIVSDLDERGRRRWAAAEARIKVHRARVAGGEDFAAVAREVSDDPISAPNGGVYLEQGPKTALPEFVPRMYGLMPGEITEPFKSPAGWHILTVNKVNPPGLIPLEKVRDQLEEMIVSGKRLDIVHVLVAAAKDDIEIEINIARD